MKVLWGRYHSCILGQKPRLGLKPLADDAGALVAIGWPGLWEHVVDHVVGFNPECLLDYIGSIVALGG